MTFSQVWVLSWKVVLFLTFNKFIWPREALDTLSALKLFLSYVWSPHDSSIHQMSCKTLCPIVYSPSMYCRSPFIFLSFIWWWGAIPNRLLSSFFKIFNEEKQWSHLEHLNAFSPVWVFSWKLWVLSCFLKSSDPENPLPHFLHLNCFTPVWSPHVSSIHQILMRSCQTLYAP